MKKLLMIILITTLPLIAFFQYKNYLRFHPPVAFDYVLNESVDAHYHNPDLLEKYYSKAVEIGSFARKKWRNESIDVRFPDHDKSDALAANAYYNQLLADVRLIEGVLHQSFEWKREGYSNEQIIDLEQGWSPAMIRWKNLMPQLKSATIGEIGEHVWLLQKQLISKGYEHELDGVYGLATQNALLDFQSANDLYPSGQMSTSTFQILFLK